MITWQTIQTKSHEWLLTARRLARLVSSDAFVHAFERSTEVERAKAHSMVEERKTYELKQWILKQQDLDRMSYSQLRQLARDYGIKNFSRMPLAYLRRRMHEYQLRREMARVAPKD